MIRAVTTTASGTRILHAPADAQRSAAVSMSSAQARASGSLTRAIDKEAEARSREDAARRKAVGETFAGWLESLPSEDAVRRVFAGLEIEAKGINKRRIASHPMRPAKTDELVAQRLSEISQAKGQGKE